MGYSKAAENAMLKRLGNYKCDGQISIFDMDFGKEDYSTPDVQKQVEEEEPEIL